MKQESQTTNTTLLGSDLRKNRDLIGQVGDRHRRRRDAKSENYATTCSQSNIVVVRLGRFDRNQLEEKLTRECVVANGPIGRFNTRLVCVARLAMRLCDCECKRKAIGQKRVRRSRPHLHMSLCIVFKVFGISKSSAIFYREPSRSWNNADLGVTWRRGGEDSLKKEPLQM